MPQVELYINNKLLDLQGDESIEVDYAIFDINKIGSRGGARSYEFELPKTNRNKEVLENPEIINNLSPLPYSRMGAIALVDGVDMLIRFAEIQSVKDFYRVRLYGANVAFYEIVKDLYLKDLSNVCDYQHHWIYNNVVNSRANTSGYIYPLIDWHTDSPNAWISDTLRQIEVSMMLPCLFVEELIQKIIEDSEYEYVNNDPSDEIMLLPCSVKPNRKANDDLYEGTFSNSIDYQLQLSPDEALFSEFWYLGWDEIIGGCGSYWNSFLFFNNPGATTEIHFGNKISFKAVWSVTIENTSPAPFNSSIVISTDRATSYDPTKRNSNNYYEEFFTLQAGATVTLSGERNLITDSVSGLITNSHYVAIWIAGVFKNFGDLYINQKGTSSLDLSDVQVLKEDSVVYSDFAVAAGGLSTYITVGGMWDIKQMDLVKQYCLLLGLIIVVDDINKKIIFNKFDKILANISSAVDWSDKLDESEDPEIVFIGGSYGQNSNFTWESDDPEAKPAGTDGTILIDNKNLEKDVDVVEMDYASSYFKTLLNGLDIPTIPVYSGGTPQNDLTQRILYLKKYTSSELDPVGDLTYYRTGTLIPNLVVSSDIPIAWFINKGQENNLGFANNILESRYAALSTIIPRFKNIKLLVRLNASDISQLDFLKPVWIQKYEAYFYLSAIKGFSYTESKSTLVELVKLNING